MSHLRCMRRTPAVPSAVVTAALLLFALTACAPRSAAPSNLTPSPKPPEADLTAAADTMAAVVAKATAAAAPVQTAARATGAAYPAPDTHGTAEALPARLADAIAACEPDGIAELLALHFVFRPLPGGGFDFRSPYYAARLITERLCADGGASIRLGDTPASLPPVGESFKGAISPAHDVLAERFATGWGEDHRGEARLVILRDTDGSAYLSAMEIADRGFEAAAGSTTPQTRTLTMATDRDSVIEVTVPAGWNSDTSGLPTLTSYLPYRTRPESVRDNPKAFAPGETKIEFYGPDDEDTRTMDERIATSTLWGDPPSHRDQEEVVLASGEKAVLVTDTYPTETWTVLYMQTNDGVIAAPCFGDQAPCAAILRTVRFR